MTKPTSEESDTMVVTREECTEQGIVVLTPTDELLTADVVKEIRAYIDSPVTKHAIIDFRVIRFFVSGSLYPHAEPLTPLIMLQKQLSQESRRLVLCNLSGEIADVFRITRLDQMFDIQPDLETALSSVSGNCA